jgi:hypothetical protein
MLNGMARSAPRPWRWIAASLAQRVAACRFLDAAKLRHQSGRGIGIQSDKDQQQERDEGQGRQQAALDGLGWGVGQGEIAHAISP